MSFYNIFYEIMNYNNGGESAGGSAGGSDSGNALQQLQARLTDRTTVGYCGFDLLAILALILMILTTILFISVIVLLFSNKNHKSLISSFCLMPPPHNERKASKKPTQTLVGEKHDGTDDLTRDKRKSDDDEIEQFDESINRDVEIFSPSNTNERLIVTEKKKNLNAAAV